MDNLGRNITIFLVVALVASAAGYWFFSNYELRDIEKDGDYSRAARENRYLAMHYFLEEMGVTVESVSGREILDELPPSTDTLFLSHSSGALSERRQQALHDWLQQGGHLITLVSENWDEDNENSGQKFFDEFGIQRHPRNPFAVEEGQEANPFMPDFDIEEDDEPVTMTFIDYDYPIEVDFSEYAYLVDASEQATGSVADDFGNTLLQYQVGEGQLTVLTNLYFLYNRNIGDYDHALFAWLLMGDESNKVWILYDISLPSLFSTAWQKAPYAIIASCLLLILWLWSLYNRFGPQHVIARQGRRSLMEHLTASARFHWETNKAASLLAQLQDSIRLKLEQHNPHWHTLSEQQQGEWLAKRTQHKPEQCLQALNGTATDERSFFHSVRILQQIQQTL